MNKNSIPKSESESVQSNVKLFDKINNSFKILVLGPKGVGKTSLLTTIKSLRENTYSNLEEQLYKNRPTVGIEIEELNYDNKNLIFKEVGSAMIPRLYKFLEENFNYILYIYCPLNVDQVSLAMNELINLLILNNNNAKIMLIINKYGYMSLDNYSISETAFFLNMIISEFSLEIIQGEVIDKQFVKKIIGKITGEEIIKNTETLKVKKHRCCTCLII